MKILFMRGYIALVTVLVLLVFSLSLLSAVPYLSLGGMQQALVLEKSESTLALLDGCIADALLLSKRDENYTGGIRDYFDARCEVSVEKNGTIWELSFVATRDHLVRTARVIVDRSPGVPGVLTLVSWLER